MRPAVDVETLEAGVRAGDRASLARAITLVESKRADHARAARTLLERLMPATGGADRIGLTGVPGVGKSTTIESFGLMLAEAGRRVAVLAVDPTSQRSGGSILGDKTRMAQLSVHPSAFIRPSPAGATLGGVARKTRETLLLCEAAGFDVVIVETVGVGQSETVVADMVDIFIALMLPNAGDELQGIKKGLLEVADAIVVNKADLDPKAAERAVRTYRDALHILAPASPAWSPPVLSASGATGAGLDALWRTVQDHRAALDAAGERAQRRAAQQVRWMHDLIRERLGEAFRAHPAIAARLPHLEADVAAGRLPAGAAADDLAALFLGTD
ncbi:MAG: methylmalonyl Co-A mutase-associated GTPase MeaB [Alphaproteobacteria bacterium]|nr:methylmalonyl Co-A mutase-associated GTPase MeaB [Alphaproteobacteria bacterium]